MFFDLTFKYLQVFSSFQGENLLYCRYNSGFGVYDIPAHLPHLCIINYRCVFVKGCLYFISFNMLSLYIEFQLMRNLLSVADRD